jgi:DNA helicase HerA-like ATPase
MTENPFDDERLHGARSALVKMTPDEQGRFSFELMCQYTRLGLHGLQVGDLIGVENYTPNTNGERVYSILTISQTYPVHFAAQGTGAYPGHMFESMRSIKEDWETQESRPMHLTTTIEIQAVSTGFQFSFNPRESGELPQLVEEENLPMIGAEIRPLSMPMVDAIINQGLRTEPNSPFNHKKFQQLNVRLSQENLLTTHFGIFGFTGVGKSNLVSSMVSSLCFENTRRSSNFILFDPNDEYLGLFIDRFISNPEEVSYIHIGSDSLHGTITGALGNDNEPSEEILQLMFQQLRLPPPLLERSNREANFRNRISQGLQNVFHRTRIVLPFEDVAALIIDILRKQTPEKSGPQVKEALVDLTEFWSNQFIGTPISADNINSALRLFRSPAVQSIINTLSESPSPRNTLTGILDRTERALRRHSTELAEIPSEAILQVGDLIDSVTNPNRRQVIIITGRRDSEIKHFASQLGNAIYERRRHESTREPYVTFIFDEADLFIPQAGTDKDTADVRELCVTLARRGRKFGLGLGISTQRSSLLDTEVMANLHTYFVSKLPRADDRQRVAEAFGISEDQLAPTFTFSRGNWLVISHDATGLKGVPIPTIAEDANARISSVVG